MADALLADACELAAVLRAAGHQVWLVGGCVRDSLLGRPLHDVDLATDATPERLKSLFPEALEVGAHFGVVLVYRGLSAIQIATFRTEFSYNDGRRPDVVRFETDVRADVQRRDFTVNGLIEDPFTGQVLDYVGGLPDLSARLIRAIGNPDERFAEDHLRLLRAIRFAARLDFTIEPATFDSIRKHASLITRISAERIREELTRILTEGGARRGLELLDSSGLLGVLLPEVTAMKGVQQPPEFHPEGDVWVHTLGLLERMDQPSVELALGCLLHDVGKPSTQTFADRIRFNGHEKVGARMAAAILSRLKFSADMVDTVGELVAQHMKFKDAPKMTPGTFKRFVRQPVFDLLLELHRLDVLASRGDLDGYRAVQARRSQLTQADLRPPVLLTGRDLMAMGYSPGPAFSHILKGLETEQLEGRINARQGAEEWVRANFATPDGATTST